MSQRINNIEHKFVVVTDTCYSDAMKQVLAENNPNVVKYDGSVGGELLVRADVVGLLDINRDYKSLAKYKKFAEQARLQAKEQEDDDE